MCVYGTYTYTHIQKNKKRVFYILAKNASPLFEMLLYVLCFWKNIQLGTGTDTGKRKKLYVVGGGCRCA